MKKILLALIIISAFHFASNTALAASRYPEIDAQIFALQKGFVADFRDTLQISPDKSTRQAGALTWKTKFSTPEASGSVSLEITSYQDTYDTKTKNTELIYNGNIALDVHSLESDYSTFDETTLTYKKKPADFSATVAFRLKAIVTSDGSTYFQITELSGKSEGSLVNKALFDSYLVMAQKYIGKMYKFPKSQDVSGTIDTVALETDLIHTLDVLASSPLFEVVSLKGDTYTLKYDKNTMKSLGWKVSPKDIITYTMSGGVSAIRISDRKNPKNDYITFSEKNGKRSIDAYVKSLGGKRGKMDAQINISKDLVYVSIKDKTTLLLLSWKDAKLDMSMKYRARNSYDTTASFDIAVRGDLALDGSKTDLVMSNAGKNIGTIKSKKIGTRGDYTMNLSVDVPLMSIMIDVIGNYTDEVGDYQVLVPSIYEVWKD